MIHEIKDLVNNSKKEKKISPQKKFRGTFEQPPFMKPRFFLHNFNDKWERIFIL
jgi:hypothetical protein